MLKRVAFRAKMLYLCTSEEEKARKHWAFSSFFAQYKGCITPDLQKVLRDIELFLSESGFSLGQVGERIDVPEKF